MARGKSVLAWCGVLLLTACGRPYDPPELRLTSPGQDWVGILSSDSSLTYSVPATYERRPDVPDCAHVGEHSQAPGFRSVCVYRDRVRRSLQDLERRWTTDSYELRGPHTDKLDFDGQVVEVERALATGGVAGVTDQREMLVRWKLPNGDWVTVRGMTGDDEGYSEILAVARTVRENRSAVERGAERDVRPLTRSFR